jgi:predicted homoserine dehydrogenase-like protein
MIYTRYSTALFLSRTATDELGCGILSHKGTVEVVSSIERDGRPVFRDLRWGVYVTFEAPSDYVRDCFSQYGLMTDDSGRYAATYRPYHLIGLELGVSIANVMLEANQLARRKVSAATPLLPLSVGSAAAKSWTAKADIRSMGR